MDDVQPMRLSRYAALYWHEGEWQPDGPQSAYMFEPLDINAPASARPHVQSGSVRFYEKSGNRLLGEPRCYDMDFLLDGTMVYLGDRESGAWYEVASGQAIYRDPPGRWFMRWLAYKNTRRARAFTAMMLALRADTGVRLPIVDELADRIREARV